jgi:GNAT superfamily N-acetyltransferase
MIIRNARAEDVNFLAEAVIYSDKSGTSQGSYAGIYQLDEDVIKKALKTIILEDPGSFELSLQCFRILEEEGRAVATLSAWVEAETGVSSALSKLTALSFVLPKGVMEGARERLTIASGLSIERTSGTLQIESVFTLEESRGRRYASMLMDSVVREYKKFRPDLSVMQIQLMKENESALKAYLHAGFVHAYSRTSDNDYICEIMPGRTKLLMEKNI